MAEIVSGEGILQPQRFHGFLNCVVGGGGREAGVLGVAAMGDEQGSVAVLPFAQVTFAMHSAHSHADGSCGPDLLCR